MPKVIKDEHLPTHVVNNGELQSGQDLCDGDKHASAVWVTVLDKHIGEDPECKGTGYTWSAVVGPVG